MRFSIPILPQKFYDIWFALITISIYESRAFQQGIEHEIRLDIYEHYLF
jgi:hypothetical protein